MRALIAVVTLVLVSLVPPASASDAIHREAYEIGADYPFEAQSPDCADAHVVCFQLSGLETSLTVSIVDFVSEAGGAPVAGHLMMWGPSGFTTGVVCGEGSVDIVSPRTSLRLELLLGGAGECTWSDSEHALAHLVAAPATRGEVIVKTRFESGDAATSAALAPGCVDAGGLAFLCAFAAADSYMTGAVVDVFAADGTSVGAGVFRVEGFFGPAIIAEAHGSAAGDGWHAGAGASDYDFDNVPDSTCACAGVYDPVNGYTTTAGVGTFDMTGDGPSVDDTFAYGGTRPTGEWVGASYGWDEHGKPYFGLFLP